MSVFKKIVAVITMVLSVIAVIVLIVALVGSWPAKAQVETTAVSLLLTGESVVTSTRAGMQRVDVVLTRSTSILTDVDGRIRELSTAVQNSSLLVDRVRESTDNELVIAVNNAVDTFNEIEANIVAINETVESFRSIPMLSASVNTRLPETTRLQEVVDKMAALREGVANLSRLLQARRAELIDGKISVITDATGTLLNDLRNTQVTLQETDQRLADSAVIMSEVRQRLPQILTMITIILNLVFLLCILAFVSLFIHAYAYFKCPQDGLSGLMPDDCARAAIEA
ncbi:MAG: hypothetical protein ACK2UT_01130 [Candidatus Promineifilaceae bacterium]